jgi:cell division protein FtsL
MGVPRRERDYDSPAVEAPLRGLPGGRSPRHAARSKAQAARRRRAFLVLVVVPVALMLGSVYVHTAAAALRGEAAVLAEEKARAEVEAERLEVKSTELSEPGRIRSLARRDLGMRDPAGGDLKTYSGSDGEDVASEGEEEKGSGD